MPIPWIAAAVMAKLFKKLNMPRGVITKAALTPKASNIGLFFIASVTRASDPEIKPR